MVDITSRAQLEKNFEASVSPALLQKITAAGSNLADRFGARPMRRAVQKYYEDCLSDSIVQGFVGDGDSVSFDLDESRGGEEAEAVVVARRASDDEELRIVIGESATDVDALLVKPTRKMQEATRVAKNQWKYERAQGRTTS